jgi:putative zinc finger/helix-turn-helix YgiT family protein
VNQKPFPWKCPVCREKKVSPVRTNYSLAVEHDGRAYEVTVHDVELPTCSQCGEVIVTHDVSARVSAELRRVAGLLQPEEIRQKREELGLTQKQLASAVRIAESTLSRWETGAQIQQRAMDLLLRLFFDSGEVRRVCAAVSASASPAAEVIGTT